MILDRTRLIDLYETMVTIRRCEESLVPLLLDGTIRCPVHLYSGQEAVATGVCRALNVDDYILGTHRSHGHFLAKGGKVTELIAEMYCRETGCSRGRGGSMHLIDPDIGMLGSAPIVGGTISLAVGAALAAFTRGDHRVSVAFFGDGATGAGGLFESMNFEALHRLPIIFVCENNFYSTHMPVRSIRVPVPIADLAHAFGMTTYQLDGNDVLTVYKHSQEAVSRCREGEGPIFMEFLTYRIRGHVGPNDNIYGTQTDIRPPEELERWRLLDPISRFEEQLIKDRIVEHQDLAVINDNVMRTLEAAHAFARQSSSPDPSQVGDNVFRD